MVTIAKFIQKRQGVINLQEFITIPADLIRQSKRGSPFSETDAIMDILTMVDEGDGEIIG